MPIRGTAVDYRDNAPGHLVELHLEEDPHRVRQAGLLCVSLFQKRQKEIGKGRHPIMQEHSKVVIQSDCGGIRQDAAVSDDCWRLVICGQGCRSRVRRSGLRDGSASMQCVLVGCGHTWCVAFCRLGVRISVSG